MAEHIEQVVCYKYNGELFETRKKAEAAALDRFGEEFDGLTKKLNLRCVHGMDIIKMVEAMWEHRAMFSDLLDCGFIPSVEVDNEE